MQLWPTSLGMDMQPVFWCKGGYHHLHSLLTRCKDSGGMYHTGFQAYVKTMTLWGQKGAPVRGNTRTGRITGVPDNGQASAAGHVVNSDEEDTNTDL